MKWDLDQLAENLVLKFDKHKENENSKNNNYNASDNKMVWMKGKAVKVLSTILTGRHCHSNRSTEYCSN